MLAQEIRTRAGLGIVSIRSKYRSCRAVVSGRNDPGQDVGPVVMTAGRMID